MIALLSIAAVASAVGVAPKLELTKPANDIDMINHVNNLHTTWKAGPSKRFEGQTYSNVKALLGAKMDGKGPKLARRSNEGLVPLSAVPASFDARTQWGKECPSVLEVRDQAACGSCWAFGAVEAMTDRHCIFSNGTNSPHISAEDMNSCCDSCGDGCGGGYPEAAWQYWVDTGVVTGGNYGSNQGCFPYSIASCDHHEPGKLKPCGAEGPTPACTQTCINGLVWNNDLHYGSNVYSIDVSQIQQEIVSNGPVESSFTVYSDFVTYRSGVYQPTSSEVLGGHAIKVLGWGTEAGVDYWWCANSWNPDWGDQGFFKIIRGVDSCGIEDGFVAGTPK